MAVIGKPQRKWELPAPQDIPAPKDVEVPEKETVKS